MGENKNEKPSIEKILTMMYSTLLDLEIKVDLFDAKVERLQEDISKITFVRSEPLKIIFDHKTDELYITKFFKIPFEGNEAILLRHMYKKSNGMPKKSVKFYPAELAGRFKSETSGLKTKKAVHATIMRIDATIKYKTTGLEIFKISTKVFYFL